MKLIADRNSPRFSTKEFKELVARACAWVIGKYRNNERLLKAALAWSLVACLTAHAFCYLNVFFSHDSLCELVRTDDAWQVSLGRFMHVPYIVLRGRINAPLVVGILEMFFLFATVVVVAKIFDTKRKSSIVVFALVLCTNSVVTLTNATYLHESDMYMFAALAASLSIYFSLRSRYGFILGAVSMAVSLGLYQAYAAFGLVIALVWFMNELIKSRPLFEVWPNVGRMALAVVAGFLLWKVGVEVSLRVYNISLSTGYNSVAGLGDYSDVDVAGLLKGAYRYFIDFFLKPDGPLSPVLAAGNVLYAAGTLVLVTVLCKSRKVGVVRCLLVMASLFLFPLVANATYLMSKGMVHDLMVYAFVCAYLVPFVLLDGASFGSSWGGLFVRGLFFLVVAMFAFVNVVFANQVYLKKYLEYECTVEIANRMINRMEQTEGFVSGDTPIVFVSDPWWSSSAFNTGRQGFDDVTGTGLENDISITYSGTAIAFFRQVMGLSNPFVTDVDEFVQEHSSVIDSMPAWPQSGSCAMVDGVMVVKVSE